MKLTTNTSATNKYKLNRPYTKDGSLTQWMKLFLFVLEGPKEGRTKKEIMIFLGVDPETVVVRGFLSKPFSILKSNKVLDYNSATKRWSKGEKAQDFHRKMMPSKTEKQAV